MKNTILSAFAPILLAGLAFGQTPAVPIQTQTPTQLAPNTLISAELSKSVDAKKLKVGDKIEGKDSFGYAFEWQDHSASRHQNPGPCDQRQGP